jgi:hypothetical protein
VEPAMPTVGDSTTWISEEPPNANSHRHPSAATLPTLRGVDLPLRFR